MPRTILAALTIAALPLPHNAMAAQDAAPDGASLVVVEGLAKDDLLNIRATASATGMVIGRLSNGTALHNNGCNEVNGYKWCNIVSVDDAKLHGWTPARYLHAAEGDATATEAPKIAEASPVASVKQDVSERAGTQTQGLLAAATAIPATPLPLAVAAPVLPLASDDATAPMASDAASGAPAAERFVPAATADAGSGHTAIPVPADLSARFGDGSAALQADGSDAVASAFKTAFARTVSPAEAESDAPGFGNDAQAAPAPKPHPSAPALQSGETQRAQRASPAVSQEAASPRVAQLQTGSISGAADAAGEVPCARYIGQPMTSCGATVARTGADAAEVTVTLPDGGRRVIRFRDGKPDGSNSRGEFRFTREGDLNMIRVGTSERYEILDSLAFGE